MRNPATITVSVAIEAPVGEVWEAVRRIESHVDWMADAESISFTSAAREGVGVTFDCVTKVGPIRLTDRMAITEWEAPRLIGVRHDGIVSGTGRFTLTPIPGEATEFAWTEQLAFPLRLGGPVTATLAAPVFKAIWRRNLRRLKRVVERGSTG